MTQLFALELFSLIHRDNCNSYARNFIFENRQKGQKPKITKLKIIRKLSLTLLSDICLRNSIFQKNHIIFFYLCGR